MYICYFLNPTKPKDFCWDVFGGGIVENLKEKHTIARVPQLDPNGAVEYLGEKYSFVDYDLNSTPAKSDWSDDDIDSLWGLDDLDYEDLFSLPEGDLLC